MRLLKTLTESANPRLFLFSTLSISILFILHLHDEFAIQTDLVESHAVNLTFFRNTHKNTSEVEMDPITVILILVAVIAYFREEDHRSIVEQPPQDEDY